MLPRILTSLLALIAATTAASALSVDTALNSGDTVPSVQVRTENGNYVNLADKLAGKTTVLVFYRGGWCPYCNKHLQALAEIESELLSLGTFIYAISPDSPESLKATPERKKIGYTLLSDSSANAAAAFGLVFKVEDELVSKYKNEYQIDIEAASGKTHHQLPHPAVYIIDSSGTIQFAYTETDYKTRLDPAKILQAVKNETHQ